MSAQRPLALDEVRLISAGIEHEVEMNMEMKAIAYRTLGYFRLARNQRLMHHVPLWGGNMK
jgi:hypothetical protein